VRDEPKVSVVIPTLDAQAAVAAAVQSAANPARLERI